MVPEGWKATEIDSLATLKSGGTPSKQVPTFWGGPHPWVSAKDLKTHYIGESIDTLTDAGFSVAKIAPQGAVLVLVRGMTLLKEFPVGIAIRDVAFNQDLKALVAKSGVDSLFLMYLLVSNKNGIRQLVNTAGHGTGRLDTIQFKAYPVNLPPFNEQTKIVQILSTWDKAIETTEKLIENSKAQKKALMQQLLTGKKRFPGFKGKWKEHLLKEIASVLVSNVDKKSYDGEDSVLLCNYTDVYYNEYITSNISFMEASATQMEIEKFSLEYGDVVITKDSESPDDIAIPALVREELPGVLCGYHLAIIRSDPELADGGFLNILFALAGVRYYFFTLANGVTRFGLSIGSIQTAKFTIPGIDEQKKIAGIIMAQDDEIANLTLQLGYLVQQRKALMQQLLTGKSRVKVN